GTIHWMPSTDVSYNGTSCAGGFTDQVSDGTGYTLSVTGQTVNSIYAKDGMRLSQTSIIDSNGNSAAYSYSTGIFTDTLGLSALTHSFTSSSESLQWPDVNGGNPLVSVSDTSYPLRSAFSCTGLLDYNLASEYIPTSIVFPDGSSLGIAYEATPGFASDRTGRLSELTLRSGGTVQYNWNPNSAANDGLNCTYLIPNN